MQLFAKLIIHSKVSVFKIWKKHKANNFQFIGTQYGEK